MSIQRLALLLLVFAAVSPLPADEELQKRATWQAPGVANVKAMMEELKRQGFKGTMVIEYEHGDLAHLDATIPLCVAAFDRIAAEVAKE